MKKLEEERDKLVQAQQTIKDFVEFIQEADKFDRVEVTIEVDWLKEVEAAWNQIRLVHRLEQRDSADRHRELREKLEKIVN